MYDEGQAEYDYMMDCYAKAMYEEGCEYEERQKRKNIGKVIKGYCNGYFGRDDYEDKIIVYETEEAICCKYLDEEWRGTYLTVANFNSEEEKNEKIAEREKFERPKE